jgi:Lipopolysaccharide kinase (Kdo/WaaP) family
VSRRGKEPTGFRITREPGRVTAADEGLYPALAAAGLLDPSRLVRRLAEAEGGPGGRGPTVVVRLDPDVRVLVRPLRRGGWLGPWLGASLLGPERPLAELTATAALRGAGAPVPRAAFAIAWRRRGPVWSGALGTLFEEDAQDALAFLASRPCPERLRLALRSAGRAVRRFHDAGGAHADLHLKNLLVRESAGSCEVLVVDLDRARVLSAVGPGERMAELMRLLRSLRKRGLLDAVGRRGCALFFGAYLGGDRVLRRRMRARLGVERLRLKLHAIAYERS